MNTVSRDIKIINRRGLHARASAKFVNMAERFDAHITVTKDGMSVDGGSIMGLMMLAAGLDSTISVAAEGEDAEAAITAIADLVEAKFGEES